VGQLYIQNRMPKLAHALRIQIGGSVADFHLLVRWNCKLHLTWRTPAKPHIYTVITGL
jgi:hypothetical protein